MDMELFDGSRYKAWVKAQRVYVKDKKCNRTVSEFAGSGSKNQYMKVANRLRNSLYRQYKKFGCR